MKLLVGALSYLVFVSVAVIATVFSITAMSSKPQAAAEIATPSQTEAPKVPRQREAVGSDSNRVPVWIVATAKYDYAPPVIDRRAKAASRPIATMEAFKNTRDERQTRARRNERDARGAIESALASRAEATSALGFQSGSNRSNDPFYRD